MLARPLCFCLLACAQAAMAAAPVGDSAPLLEEIVVSASRIAQNSSVGVNRVLPTQSSDTLPLLSADLLRATPGVFVQQTTPGQSVPIVRGLKGSQVLHLVDGFRLSGGVSHSPRATRARGPHARTGATPFHPLHEAQGLRAGFPALTHR